MGKSFSPLVMSGVQPTGDLHLGNYLGAIRNFVSLQNSYDCVFCIVDLHALTMGTSCPRLIYNDVLETAAAFLACGIDAEKHIIVQQSRILEHSMLCWVLTCTARMGWLNRMTQFKEKSGKHSENISVGLYSYPILMSADILIYRATHVPVGNDQKQHIEFCRDLAGKFNNDYKVDFFPEPEPLIMSSGERVMSLRDASKKMSKSDLSDMSRINLTDNNDIIARKIRKAKTDSLVLPDNIAKLQNRLEAKNLLSTYAALCNCDVKVAVKEFTGKNFSTLKEKLIEVITDVISPINKEMQKLCFDRKYLESVLETGRQKAHKITKPVMEEVNRIIGIHPKK